MIQRMLGGAAPCPVLSLLLPPTALPARSRGARRALSGARSQLGLVRPACGRRARCRHAGAPAEPAGAAAAVPGKAGWGRSARLLCTRQPWRFLKTQSTHASPPRSLQGYQRMAQHLLRRHPTQVVQQQVQAVYTQAKQVVAMVGTAGAVRALLRAMSGACWCSVAAPIRRRLRCCRCLASMDEPPRAAAVPACITAAPAPPSPCSKGGALWRGYRWLPMCCATA